MCLWRVGFVGADVERRGSAADGTTGTSKVLTTAVKFVGLFVSLGTGCVQVDRVWVVDVRLPRRGVGGDRLSGGVIQFVTGVHLQRAC